MEGNNQTIYINAAQLNRTVVDLLLEITHKVIHSVQNVHTNILHLKIHYRSKTKVEMKFH